MKFPRLLVLGLSLLGLALSIPAEAGSFKNAGQNGVRDEYVVVLKEGSARLRHQPEVELPSVVEVAASLSHRFQGTVTEVWENALAGFVLQIPAARAEALARDPRVASVEQNYALDPREVLSTAVGDCYQASSTHKVNTRALPSTSPQTIVCDDPDPSHDTTGAGQTPRCIDNWGLDRIDQTSSVRNGQYTFDRAGRNPGVTNVHVFVVDGGVYAGHQEFLNAGGQSRILAGFDATYCSGPNCTYVPNLDDCNDGHGTHVSALIGGRTYGVAKDVYLIPVKFGCNDRPFLSTYAVRALDWIASTSAVPGVVNWSGGNSDDLMTNSAVVTAAQGVLNRGYLLVQSAGNQSTIFDYTSPATPGLVQDACYWSLGGTAAAGAMIVGGSDENDARWTRVGTDPRFQEYWDVGDRGSNYGACIDIWAPAAHVISASKFGPQAYCRLSGTSMAAPHVAGAAALYLQAHPLATPAQVTQALLNGGTWNVLATTGPNRIGTGSPNILLYSKVP